MRNVNDFRVARYLMIATLSVFILAGMYGGCGGSGGGNNPPPPTAAPPTNPPPTQPPPTNPPPTDAPPADCQMPPLDTDFSDISYFFVDTVNAILIGVTSTGDDVIMVLADIPDSGTTIGLLAGVVSADVGIIDTLVIEDLLFPASGQCIRSNGGETFSVLDFESLGVQLVDVIGECFEVAALNTSQMSVEQSLTDEVSRVTRDLTDESSLRNLDQDKTNILDFILEFEK